MLIYLFLFFVQSQLDINPVARIQYGGGGDWYGNKTTFKNIYRFYEETFNAKMPLKEETIKLTEQRLFSFPMLYISGHGNIKFEESEIINLRDYLQNGGFLFIDDDFGMDKAIRREMKKVMPNSEFVELPFSHEIFKYPYAFSSGLPKIHEHKGGQPKAFALFHQDRMVAFYSFNTDISDGCEDKSIHGNSDAVRLKALKMATNILAYALNQ